MVISENLKWFIKKLLLFLFFRGPDDFAAENWKKFPEVTIIKLKNLSLKALQF